MKQHKTAAVILDTTDVFDADRLFLLFTRAFGKVRARAKGVRKPSSKLTGHLLAFIPTKLELLESGEFFLIVQAQVESAYAQGSAYPENTLLFIRQATIVAETINRIFTEREAHPEVYDGLVYTLDRLRDLCVDDSQERKARLVAAEFLFKAMGALGYQPELSVCVATGKPLSEDFVAWNSQLGGALSKEGFTTSQEAGRPLKYPRSLVVLRQLGQPEFRAEILNISLEVEEEACQLVYDYVQTQLGQPLKSLYAG